MIQREPGRVPQNAARRAAFSSVARNVLVLGVGLIGGSLCVAGSVPLPWLIGPLVAVALLNMVGARLTPAAGARAVGQWAIGVALGLYFSPEVVREILRLFPWVLAAIIFALALGIAGAFMLARSAATDGTTAFFAMAIGGASEMATQGERNGGRVDRIAAAHSLRLMIVVLAVPLAFNALQLHGVDPAPPAVGSFSWTGIAVLAAVTAAAAVVMERLDWPNGWMLGPLLVTAMLTANGLHFSTLPAPIVNAGQLLIGVSLGSHFTSEFFRAAPRYLSAVALITVGYLLAATLFGLLLSRGSGLNWATAVIATTPGGIGEMALTARALDLGVPIVTAFHALRMGAVVMTVGPVFRWWQRRSAGEFNAD